MAQKILLRRGPIGSIPSVASQQGELLLATGSISDLSGPFITMTGTAGTGTSTIVGKIYEGSAAPDITSNSPLTGTPFYATGNKSLYRLNHAGNERLDLTGNLEGNTVSAMTVTTLTGTTINLSGDITGSNLLLSGNATIDGNIVLGGNITIGDANTDNISLGGEFTSDLIPDADNTYAVGSATRRWNVYGVDSVISGSFSGSFQGDGSQLTGLVTELSISDGSNTDTVDLLTDTLTFTNASTHGFTFSVTDNTVTLNTPQDLRTSASPTFAGATAGNIKVGVTGDNEIDTTSGNLTIDSAGGTTTVDDNLDVTGQLTVTGATDLNSSLNVQGNIVLDGAGAQSITNSNGNLSIASTAGNVSVEGSVFAGNDVTIPGNLTVQGTTTTIDSTEVNIGDNIITLNAAGTVADGGVQVIDTTGTAGTGSILWNATDDYWYAGISGSTHYRVATYTNADPTTNAIPKVDANNRLIASNIADTGTQVDISVDLDLNGNDLINVNSIEIDGLAANSFVHTNGSKVISTITPSVDGDLFQWNGSAFVASNVIDGGTF
jgi:predicted acyltransferase (DUF342 family)